ncbi:helix-turn-helix domain-containing protein [Marinomonas dokdonensis]|uniref:helix-turn-helix domain-containing protein n=1 Tax=Marinomonas dokdonensis TaxID=328224 RepID=UPI0040553D46
MHVKSVVLANESDQHNHNHHQLIIAERGHALFEIDGKGGVVDNLHGCIAPASETHYFEGIGENSHIVIDIPSLPIHSRLETLFERPHYFSADDSLKMLISYLSRESNTFELFPEAGQGCTLSLVASLHSRILGDTRQYKDRKKLDVDSISRFIDEHIDQKLSIAQLAEMYHVSPGHFSELFTKAASVTPYQFILRKRLEKAYDLILTTNKPLSIVAEEAGFSNQSAMTNLFQRHYGHTPRHLRSY